MSVHSDRGAFGHAAVPDAFSLDPSGRPGTGQIAFTFEPPAVHHLPLATRSPEVLHDAVRQRRPRGPIAALIVSLLQARSLDEALDVAQALLDTVPTDDPQRASVERTIAVAVGRDPLPARWGADPVADWMRARLVLATDRGQSWLGILGWLGRHAGHWSRSPAAVAAMPLTAAALTVAHGPDHALASVAATLRALRRTRKGLGLLRVLLLRCARAGVFLPESLRRLVPSPRRGGALVAAAWKPLLLARRALADHRHIVGAAHLTAALTATEVRRLLLAALRPRGLEHRVPAWGSRPLAEEEARELHGFLQRDDDDGIAGVTHLSSTPWPSDWGGPDTHAIVSTLSRLIGSEPLAREAFLHDGLALSAIHVLSGNATNAMAALGTSRTPPAFDEARTALARVIHGGVSSSTLPVDRPSGPEVDAIHRQLREMPDPSLALETPYWLLGAQRAEAQYILQASGRLQDFRRLRLVLERPDVATSLAPYWLLGERPEVEKWLVDLVRRTAMQLAPPTPDECRRFLRSLE